MNNRMRQQRRAADMMIRSRSRGRYGLSNLADAFGDLSEKLAPVVKALGKFVAALQVVPSAIRGEPVNVIRCKDCEHWRRNRRAIFGGCFCERLAMCRPADFYCAYGLKMPEND